VRSMPAVEGPSGRRGRLDNDPSEAAAFIGVASGGYSRILSTEELN
jgi:hypothetical protein